MNGNYTVESASTHVTKQQLINDFKVVVADAEALLAATAGQGGEAVEAVRAKTEASLAMAKAKIADAQAALLVKTKAAAKATDEYVHTHPWQSVGAAASVGMVIGLLIGRH